MRLANKIALVTGAAGPMGLGVAKRFAEEGASLIITDISGRRLEAAVDEITPLLAPGARVFAHRASVLVEAEVDELLAASRQHFDRVDILINIVGGLFIDAKYTPVLEVAEERWDGCFRVNLKGIFYLVRKLAPGMLERRWGKIVNVSSVEYAGAAGHADYAAAKAGVTSLTRSLAVELAPHINVNCIAPGIIRTLAIRDVGEDVAREFEQKNLMKRMGEPLDIANAALFFSNDESSYVTGVTLPVSGGLWPAL
ncbi:MAG: SDR family oxidoreductase [Pseudomonadales bacterium]|nr:SDR family oxidoreductase [Pseudomonadales bacterium]